MSENAVEEVREFLDRLPHRSPQEAIGMRDEGGLLKGLIMGAIGLAVLTLLCTIVPFVWSSLSPAKTPTASTADATEQGATPTNDPSPNSGTSEVNSAEARPAAADVADPDRVLDSLGIGEAKDSAPNVNPRESDLDNLLDGVK